MVYWVLQNIYYSLVLKWIMTQAPSMMWQTFVCLLSWQVIWQTICVPQRSLCSLMSMRGHAKREECDVGKGLPICIVHRINVDLGCCISSVRLLTSFPLHVNNLSTCMRCDNNDLWMLTRGLRKMPTERRGASRLIHSPMGIQDTWRPPLDRRTHRWELRSTQMMNTTLADRTRFFCLVKLSELDHRSSMFFVVLCMMHMIYLTQKQKIQNIFIMVLWNLIHHMSWSK